MRNVIRNASFPSLCYDGSPYRNRSTASQASVPPSKLHPKGPRSHSAQMRNLTFPRAAVTPGASGGKESVDCREKPMFSNAIGDPAICQYIAFSDSPSAEEEATAAEGGNGDLPSDGICDDQTGSTE